MLHAATPAALFSVRSPTHPPLSPSLSSHEPPVPAHRILLRTPPGPLSGGERPVPRTNGIALQMAPDSSCFLSWLHSNLRTDSFRVPCEPLFHSSQASFSRSQSANQPNSKHALRVCTKCVHCPGLAQPLVRTTKCIHSQLLRMRRTLGLLPPLPHFWL